MSVCVLSVATTSTGKEISALSKPKKSELLNGVLNSLLRAKMVDVLFLGKAKEECWNENSDMIGGLALIAQEAKKLNPATTKNLLESVFSSKEVTVPGLKDKFMRDPGYPDFKPALQKLLGTNFDTIKVDLSQFVGLKASLLPTRTAFSQQVEGN